MKCTCLSETRAFAEILRVLAATKYLNWFYLQFTICILAGWLVIIEFNLTKASHFGSGLRAN